MPSEKMVYIIISLRPVFKCMQQAIRTKINNYHLERPIANTEHKRKSFKRHFLIFKPFLQKNKNHIFAMRFS